MLVNTILDPTYFVLYTKLFLVHMQNLFVYKHFKFKLQTMTKFVSVTKICNSWKFLKCEIYILYNA